MKSYIDIYLGKVLAFASLVFPITFFLLLMGYGIREIFIVLTGVLGCLGMVLTYGLATGRPIRIDSTCDISVLRHGMAYVILAKYNDADGRVFVVIKAVANISSGRDVLMLQFRNEELLETLSPEGIETGATIVWDKTRAETTKHVEPTPID